MQAAGLTPDRLAAQLEQALTMLNEPDVTVSVIQVNSKTYTLTGQVMRAGKFPMPTPIKISEALNLAGGFGQWANLKKITIVRGNDRIYFNYNDWKKGKNLDKDIFLQSGDQIIAD
jgi:protein involved in polysaccharide export with SLBB domain